MSISRLAILTGAILLVLWLTPAAQADPLSAKGCLEKDDESGELVLRSVQGTFELTAEDDVDLSAHVGHWVGVSGETVAEAEEGEEGHQHAKVEQLKHISEECRL